MEEEPTIEDVTFELPSKEILPPSDGESMAVFLPEENEILVVGVLIDGHTGHTAALKAVDVVEGSLRIEIHDVEKEDPGQFVVGGERPIPYEMTVEFDRTIPHEVTVEHYSWGDEMQYEWEITYYP